MQRQPQQQQQQSLQQAQPQPQIVRSPFSLMRRMMEDMDRMFEELSFGRSGLGLGDIGDFGRMQLPQMFNPDVDVAVRDGNLVVHADLPGLSQNDVRVNVVGDELVIEGERKSEEEKNEGGYYLSERSYGSFERRIPLPRGVDVSACDASFENGVLEIKLPLPKENKRSIDIKSGGGGGGARATQQQLPQQQQQQQQQSQSVQGKGGVANGPPSQSPRH